MPGPNQLFLTGIGEAKALIGLQNIFDRIGLFTGLPFLKRGFDPLGLIPATYSGYAPIDLTGTWGLPTLDTDGNMGMVAPPVIFTKTGAVGNPKVTGLYFFYSAGGGILAAQYFVDGPYRMTLDGDNIRVTPTIVAGSPIFPESNLTDP